MPRKKKTIVEETIPDDAPAVDDISDAICILTKVYKINSGGKSFCFQTTEPVDEVTIQAQFPTGGKFIVQEFNSMNDVIGTTHIDIEPKPLSISSNGNGDDMRMRLFMDELNFSRNMMLKMIESLAIGNRNGSGTPLGELASAMQVVNEISSKSNPVDLILKGMELGMKSNGGTDWKTELISGVKDVIPAVAQMTANRQLPQGQQTMIQTTPAGLIKQGIDWLKPQILAGITTDLAIGWVIQNAKDPLYGNLINTAIKGDVNSFIEIDSELANEPYKTWFESAIQLLKDEYAAATQQSDDTPDNDRGDRHDTNSSVNAPTSTRKPKITKVS